MQCPACGRQLQTRTAGGVTVDVCDGGCGGIWFDQLELRKLDDAEEAAGEELLDVARDPNVAIDYEARWKCPKCPDTVMMRHFYSPRKQVEVDECASCGGFWLDAGELTRIRGQYESNEERRAAAHRVFEDVYSETMAAEVAEEKTMLDRTMRVARFFRFICPTYYLPGKQSWGAF